MDKGVEYQLQNLLEALTSPVGLFALAGYVVLAVCTVAFPRTRWVLIAALMLIASFGFSKWTYQVPLLAPFQQLRTTGRGACAAILVLLLIPTFQARTGWRPRLMLWGTIAFFGFQLVFGTRMLVGGDFLKGFLSILTLVLAFLTLGIGLSRWLQSVEDAERALGAIVLAGAVFGVATAVHLALRRSAVVWNTRLLGLTGNPQHAAALLAGTLVPACYLLARSGASQLRRLALSAVIGLTVILLVWTGSRTGALMAVVGLGMLFRARIGRLFGVVLVVGAVTLVGLQVFDSVFQEGLGTAERLLSTQNTRGAAWRGMWGQFMASPLVGHSSSEAEFTENSYLSTGVRSGLVGLIPLLIATVTIAATVWRLIRARRFLGPDAFLADAVVAGITSLFAGSLFEGFLLAIYSFPIYSLYVYLATTAFLLDYATAIAANGAGVVPPADEAAWSTAGQPDFAPEAAIHHSYGQGRSTEY